MSVEVLCLLFFLFRFCHAVYFSIPRIFWRDTKNILILAIIVVSIVLLTYAFIKTFIDVLKCFRYLRRKKCF